MNVAQTGSDLWATERMGKIQLTLYEKAQCRTGPCSCSINHLRWKWEPPSQQAENKLFQTQCFSFQRPFFPLRSISSGFLDNTFLNQTLLAMHWVRSCFLCRMHPSPTELISWLQRRTPKCTFVYIVSTSSSFQLHNITLRLSFHLFTFHTYDSAPPFLHL